MNPNRDEGMPGGFTLTLDSPIPKSLRMCALATLVLFLLLFLASCGSAGDVSKVSQDMDQKFRDMISIDDLNESLELVLPEGTQVSIDDIITLLLFNRSNKQIAFERDHGVRAFVPTDGGEWRELPNRMRYLGNGEILEPETGTFSNYVTLIGLQPEFPPIEPPVILRIFVSGQVLDKGQPTAELAGAYIDLEIPPEGE